MGMGRPLSRGHEQFARGHEVEALILARKALQLGLTNVDPVAVPVNENDGYISPVNSPSVENAAHFDFYHEPVVQPPNDIAAESEETLIKNEEINPPMEDASELPPHELEILTQDCKDDVEKHGSDNDLNGIMKSQTCFEERPKSRVRFRDEVEECPISDVCNGNEQVFFITADGDTVDNANLEPAQDQHPDEENNNNDSQTPDNVISHGNDNEPTSNSDHSEFDDDHDIEIPPHELLDKNIPSNKPHVSYVHYETSCPQVLESSLVLVPEDEYE